MPTSNKLHELISSMSKSEKSYYKRYLSLHVKGDKGNYSRLFDVFSATENYDPVKIKETLSHSPVLKHFSSYQVHLYNSILTSLRSYHREEKNDTFIIESLFNSILLKDKGLHSQSDKMLQQAEKSAEACEDLLSLLKIHELRQKNNYQTPDLRQLQQQEKEMYASLANLLDKIKEKNTINQLFDKTLILYLKHGEKTTNKTAINSLLKILDEPLLKKDPVHYTRELLYRVFDLKEFLYYTLGDYSAFQKHIDLHLIALENDPDFKNGKLNTRYAAVLSNKIHVSGISGNIRQAEIAFHKIRSLRADSIQLEIKYFHCSYGNIIDIYINCGAIEKCLGMAPEIIRGINRFENKFTNEQSLLFKGNLAIIYFSAGDYAASLKWIHKINSGKVDKCREDIMAGIKTLEILVHYELRNFLLVESLIHSLRRMLVKGKRFDMFSKILVTNMKKLVYVADRGEIQQLFISFKLDMDAACRKEKNSNPWIITWINRHALNNPALLKGERKPVDP